MKKTALADLADWLLVYHSRYTLDDIKVSQVKGFLETTKPCTCTYPPYDGYTIGFPSGEQEPHYHTLDVSGSRRGYGHGIYGWWRAIKLEMSGSEV